MKKNRIIAMLLGTALLVCGCQQTSKATDEEKKIESEKNTTKTEENAYQGKLDLITPAAYNNTDGLKLKKGDYIIMMSDGVSDGGGGRGFLSQLKEIVLNIRSENPQTICDLILNQSADSYIGKERDDLTVLVAKLM